MKKWWWIIIFLVALAIVILTVRFTGMAVIIETGDSSFYFPGSYSGTGTADASAPQTTPATQDSGTSATLGDVTIPGTIVVPPPTNTTNQTCGNGICEPSNGEDTVTCKQDCFIANESCGNGICEIFLNESADSCPSDCTIEEETETYVQVTSPTEEEEFVQESPGSGKATSAQLTDTLESLKVKYFISCSNGQPVVLFREPTSSDLVLKAGEECGEVQEIRRSPSATRVQPVSLNRQRATEVLIRALFGIADS